MRCKLGIIFMLLCGGGLFAISDPELLKQADALVSYYGTDFSAEYTIVQTKPGEGNSTTIAAVFRRDSQETYVMIILQPSIIRGQGYLKQGKTLWFYDPESKRFNTTSSSDRFRNTNARNSDFTRSTLSEDYKVVSGQDVMLGKFKCRLLDLEAIAKGLEYPIMKIWVSEDGLVRKTEDYSLEKRLLRTSAVVDYYQIGGRFIPKQILFVEELLGATINNVFIKEKTLVTIVSPKFDKVADSVYSKTFLENVNQ
ncbi:MAG: outer membrane lipoprotein-sorting protein [Treponema sp.]|nr:outer membrane lipoprotein-sorting protein [Treponema sp.]